MHFPDVRAEFIAVDIIDDTLQVFLHDTVRPSNRWLQHASPPRPMTSRINIAHTTTTHTKSRSARHRATTPQHATRILGRHFEDDGGSETAIFTAVAVKFSANSTSSSAW